MIEISTKNRKLDRLIVVKAEDSETFTVDDGGITDLTQWCYDREINCYWRYRVPAYSPEVLEL